MTVWVRPGLKQEQFAVESATLDLIFEAHHRALADEVIVSSAAGSVISRPDMMGEAHWRGRNIQIITHASSINGVFPLYDSLYLETKAGSIDADLTPHEGLNGLETEALLTLRASAGSIHANTPVLESVESGIRNTTLASIPKRDYKTNNLARAGKVDLKLIHGSHTTIQTSAGPINAELTLWLDPLKQSKITAESSAEPIDITVRDAIAYRNQPLRHLSGDYQFATGSLTLR